MKTGALTKAMCTAIHRFVDQAFNHITEESENKHFERFIINKPLRPVPTQGIVEQAKQNGELSPQRGNRGRLQTPTRWPRMHLMKDIVKQAQTEL